MSLVVLHAFVPELLGVHILNRQLRIERLQLSGLCEMLGNALGKCWQHGRLGD